MNEENILWRFPEIGKDIEDPLIFDCIDFSIFKTGLFPEGFKCLHCGGCCTNIWGGYVFSPTPRDIKRWRKNKRYDILEFVDCFRDCYEAWVDPITQDDMDYCPWKKKVHEQYFCAINDVKPDHCRVWTPSKESALKVKCKAWLKNPWKS